MHPDQASPTRAEAAFAFLADLGYLLGDEWVTGGESYRDGWRLGYASETVTITVEYLDQQLGVLFMRGEVEADYLAIDRELFGRRSGLHGDMFPPDKVGSIIDAIAADIRENYCAILRGEDAEWSRIERIVGGP
jgi:hypothetical protein